jgi:hypothetical protein
MSSTPGLPTTPDEVGALIFDPPSAPDREDDLPASLPQAGSEVMVVRSLRLPSAVDDAVAAAARAAGVPKTTWIRQAIETSLALQAEEDQPISRIEALRALTLLRPARRVA